jgi:multiple PDZ domain protein
MFGCMLLVLNIVLQPEPNLVVDVVRNPQPIGAAPILTTTPSLPVLTMDMMPLETPLPEMEKFTVELKKDYHGLGITIAGYVCEKGELAVSKIKLYVEIMINVFEVRTHF